MPHRFAAVAMLVLALALPRPSSLLAQSPYSTPWCRSASVDTLLLRLRDANPEVRGQAALCLGDRNPAGVPVVRLLRQLVDTDSSVRARALAVHGLTALGAAARAALPSLVRQLRSNDVGLRWLSAQAIGMIGCTGLSRADVRAMTSALGAGLLDTSDMVRQTAMEALARFGADAVAVLPAAVLSPDTFIAWRATQVATRASWDSSVAKTLSLAIHDPRVRVRSGAARALAGYGETGMPLLRQLLTDSGAPVREAAQAAVRIYQAASAAPVYRRCYNLRVGAWLPPLALGADSVFLAVPQSVQFSPSPYDAPWAGAVSMRVEPLGSGRWGSGAWSSRGDTVTVLWSTGLSGVSGELIARQDTLRGSLTTFWDFGREQQRAPVTAVHIPCP